MGIGSETGHSRGDVVVCFPGCMGSCIQDLLNRGIDGVFNEPSSEFSNGQSRGEHTCSDLNRHGHGAAER